MGTGTDYKPMARAGVLADSGLTLQKAVAASVASFRDDFRKIVGSEPICETSDKTFTLATYGAGRYVEMSRFSIEQLPGCCGAVVFYHASVATDFQNKGLGRLLLAVREEAARKAGYTFAQATVLKTNKAERGILEAEGWETLAEFENQRTENVILVYGKNLRASAAKKHK